MIEKNSTPLTFADLCLSGKILQAVTGAGYVEPTAIQSQAIPLILEGRDLIGQAETGTGKTAAFALPLLDKLDLSERVPQVIVLTPTRELAIQVSESFAKYGKFLSQLNVVPIYGGQEYRTQINSLRRGAHVVVGTPGRVIDQIKRGCLDLTCIKTLVLDEADEMLRMGFIDDVEWILEQTPQGRQVALFSATLPRPIRRIADRHLNNPKEVMSQSHSTPAEAVNQRCYFIKGMSKLDALSRIIETEDSDGLIVFVRTKLATLELADKLLQRGFTAAALNGDMEQRQREHTVQQFKNAEVDILVATDVAARGLDVSRVSHVVNYDAPHDVESYVHRIGRTGRAGKSGEAVLFLAAHEMRILRNLERTTRVRVEVKELPTIALVRKARVGKLKKSLSQSLESEGIDRYLPLAEELIADNSQDAVKTIAGLVKLLSKNRPIFSKKQDEVIAREDSPRKSESGKRSSRRHPADDERMFGRGGERDAKSRGQRRPDRGARVAMERYTLDVGRAHGVRPGNIVGAIANEGQIESEYIGAVQIYDSHSTVDLPIGMPPEVFKTLQKAWVAGRQLNIARMS